MVKSAHCAKHGVQGIGLVCTRVAHAIDNGELVGLFCGDDTDTARPDAWCASCENKLHCDPVATAQALVRW